MGYLTEHAWRAIIKGYGIGIEKIEFLETVSSRV